MGWANVFETVTNILKLISMIGPIIDFIEMIFGKIFPGKKTGQLKKEVAMKMAEMATGGKEDPEVLSAIIDGYVEEKNREGVFTHSLGFEESSVHRQ